MLYRARLADYSLYAELHCPAHSIDRYESSVIHSTVYQKSNVRKNIKLFLELCFAR